MSETVRAFIAIELSREIKDALERIEDTLRIKVPDVKWVRPENIHLTLKFLGHIKPDTVNLIKIILEDIAKNTKSFPVRLSLPGAFPSAARPRVIWVGIDKGMEESIALASAIEDRISDLEIEKEERTFHPHLTLGRIDVLKNKDALKEAFSSLKIPPIETTASKITLFQSTLTRNGAVYNILREVEFSRAS